MRLGQFQMGFAESYTGFCALPITIKQGSYGSMSCGYPDRIIQAFAANSVGVLPVTCRKAWENAGTLA